jgi:hypothetical protein
MRQTQTKLRANQQSALPFLSRANGFGPNNSRGQSWLSYKYKLFQFNFIRWFQIWWEYFASRHSLQKAAMDNFRVHIKKNLRLA